MQVLSEIEKTRRAELNRDLRAALAQGQSLDEYRAAHEQRVDRWVQLFYAEMERLRSDDPVECLPNLMAKLEESAIAAARAAAKAMAEEQVKAMLRKAIV
jgi:hypothetical protein